MDKNQLEKIKEIALEQHIPIIMDETLETIKDYLKTLCFYMGGLCSRCS